MTIPNHGVRADTSVFSDIKISKLYNCSNERGFNFPDLCFDAKADDTVVPATFSSKQGLLHGSLVNMMLNNC